MNNKEYACWYLVNGYPCKHQHNCKFSHDPYIVYEYRANLDLCVCHHGFHCPTKCNKVHNQKELFYDCYNETRKRKRDVEEKEEEIRKLKTEMKENVDCTKLKYALGQSRREMKAIKEVHKEVLSREYLDENYKHLQKNQQEFTQLFNRFRLDFYNTKEDDAESAIRMVEKYICDVNDAIQHRCKKIAG